jgi:hypothetical protein
VEKVRFQLSPKNQVDYDRGDEWFTWDPDAINDMRASELIALEAEVGLSMGDIAYGLERKTALAMTAAIWITRRIAGVKESWELFDPQVRRVTWETVYEAAPTDPTGGEDGPSRLS